MQVSYQFPVRYILIESRILPMKLLSVIKLYIGERVVWRLAWIERPVTLLLSIHDLCVTDPKLLLGLAPT